MTAHTSHLILKFVSLYGLFCSDFRLKTVAGNHLFLVWL